MASTRRLTQRDIARMTGVSQATVSLVLNGRADGEVRIAPETRDRVLQAIRDSGYVADPIARRLAAQHNRIIGVFGYEPVFGVGSAHFYHPFLVGIEEQAEAQGSDLLLLTSAPVVDGRRRIFHEGNRIRLADGCILLGRSLDPEDLQRLLHDGLPFVSVGRRDDAGGPVPYVGADYPSAVAELVQQAAALGHERMAYVGEGAGPESWADRMSGFQAGAAATGVEVRHERGPDLAAVLESILQAGVTAVLVEEYSDAVALARLAAGRGLAVPLDLSVLTLGQPTRPVQGEPLQFTGFEIPRHQMGREAVQVLTGLIDGSGRRPQRLLPCPLVEGATLAPPRRRRTSRKQGNGA
ncbi:LacI family transcriptional regulator [Kineosporia sp. NBRC 101677]|uniref:LacI family DNA-binding transcriptional regulator n=1 Tax=Kineosporia sp. NBRC 101677 TaxID=3032197 RepID=UPI0024A4E85F|nr:LacI family DNA-binding transcriptional regulator [Kineosporia sp. NBRC 101677]GLY20103.1 LacI family transcriptional regulator [Kineosporia sp. NBRC 101677]